MSSTDIGRGAESAAAEYLRQKGFRVIAQNWRTRWCEIDIIATYKKTVYFVEVKYRHTDQWGDGIDAISAKKLRQMHFAAELWISQQDKLSAAMLAVISVSGQALHIDSFIELD